MGIGEARNDVKQITISAMLVFERSDNFVYLNYPTKINNRIGSKYYGLSHQNTDEVDMHRNLHKRPKCIDCLSFYLNPQ